MAFTISAAIAASPWYLRMRDVPQSSVVVTMAGATILRAN